MVDTSNSNEIFFSMLNHVLEEQQNVDWAFKTSLVFIKGFDEELSQTPIQKPDQLPNILEYLEEAKPYHTEFSGLTEQQSATTEVATVNINETINPKVTLHYDRVSYETDMDGFDTGPFDYQFDADGEELGFDNLDYRQQNLHNAANRIYFYYDPDNDDETKDISDLVGAKFRGLSIDGGDIDLDEILFDAQFFEKFGFDVPSNEAFYEITDSPTLPFTDYEALVDAATGTTDYGFLNDAVTSTLDWGSVDDPVTAPASATTFPLPDAIFPTKKVVVYYDQTDGSRALATDPYSIIGLNVVFDDPPPVGVTVHLAVLDYDYIYDKVYVSNDNWDPSSGTEDTTLDGIGFLRPHWDKNHPEELVRTGITENLDIRVYTNQAQVLGNDPGFDESPYDTLGFDLAEDDLTLTTGGGPYVSRESYYKSELLDTHELGAFPQSNEAFFLFEDGLLKTETTDYTISWDDPVYEDALRDDHITNPQVTFVGSPTDSTKIDYLHYGLGGSPVVKRKVFYNTSATTFDMEVQIPGNEFVTATVDGVLATTDFSGNNVSIVSPAAINSTVVIAVHSDEEFTQVKSQYGTSIVFTLDDPPSSTVPGYMGIQVWQTDTGTRLNPPYTKIHQAKAGEDTYAASVANDILETLLLDDLSGDLLLDDGDKLQLDPDFDGTVQVYVDGVLQTPGIGNDYIVSGNSVVFNSIPSLGAEIVILAFRDEEFTLSTTVTTNDTLTITGKDYLIKEDGTGFILLENGDELLIEDGIAADNTPLRIVTFGEDLSMGMRTENHRGNPEGIYDIGWEPTTQNDLWVYVDGVLVHPGVDYRYVKTTGVNDTYEIHFFGTFAHLNSQIQITYLKERSAVPSLGFRMNQTPNGDVEYYRIADRHITELVGDFESGTDTEILVADASVLGQPSPKSVPAPERIPGKIWIAGEQIEFWEIDYSSAPHKLKTLRPGHKATAMGLSHAAGSKVYDGSRKQLLPNKVVFNQDSHVRHETQGTGISTYSIPGVVRELDDVKVWVTPSTFLVNDFVPADEIITVDDSSVLSLPGATTLATDIATPSGSFLVGDALNIQLNGNHTELLMLTGTDATSLKTLIDSIPGLTGRLLTTSVDADTLSWNHAGGGDLIFTNNTGSALYDLFGGQITGSVSAPTVTNGGGEGLTLNGVDIVWNGATLNDVLLDITTAVADTDNTTLANIIVREKGDVLQIIDTHGAAITVADLVGTATTELGISSSAASNFIIVNPETGIPEVSGTRSSTKGSIAFDQERVSFGYYDPSITGGHVLGEFTRTFEDIPATTSYPAGQIIVGSQLNLQTRDVEYEQYGSKLKFKSGSEPSTGSLIRIQNRAVTSNNIIPDDLQRSTDIVTRFLSEAPGSINE